MHATVVVDVAPLVADGRDDGGGLAFALGLVNEAEGELLFDALEDVEAAAKIALAQRPYQRVTLIGKSIGTLALGLVSGPLLLLSRSDVYEVAIGCGYALTMLALLLLLLPVPLE